MTRDITWQLIAAVAVIVLVAGTMGCGGSSTGTGGDQGDVDTGTVSGQILYFTTDQGLQNIVVVVGGQSDTTDENGNFTITGVPVGQDREVEIRLPDWLAMPTQDPILVDVVSGETTTLPDPIRLINAADQPPHHPYK